MINDLGFLSKTVISITGGTGSFGNKMVRRLLESDVKEIRIISRDENKQERMRLASDDTRLKFVLSDVRNYQSLKNAITGSTFLFHAAALKIVPSCEFNAIETADININGAINTVNIMKETGCAGGVFLSTDKAVYPINTMGLTKALMEKIVLAESGGKSKHGSRFMCTRYGNVIASRGSVLPLFVKQMLSNRLVTITDPSMTRFLMSLDQAINLVLHALQHGENGDTFILKSPACTVLDLAMATGKILGTDPNIKIIGYRHGEKMHETLIGSEEMSRIREDPVYYTLPTSDKSMNYHSSDIPPNAISPKSPYTSQNTRRLSVEEIIDLIKIQVEAISNNPQDY